MLTSAMNPVVLLVRNPGIRQTFKCLVTRAKNVYASDMNEGAGTRRSSVYCPAKNAVHLQDKITNTV